MRNTKRHLTLQSTENHQSSSMHIQKKIIQYICPYTSIKLHVNSYREKRNYKS